MSLLQRRLHKAKKERKMRFGTALIGCIHAVCTVGDQPVLWSCCPATISMFLVCEPTRGSYAVASHSPFGWRQFFHSSHKMESLYVCWIIICVLNCAVGLRPSTTVSFMAQLRTCNSKAIPWSWRHHDVITPWLLLKSQRIRKSVPTSWSCGPSFQNTQCYAYVVALVPTCCT